jgi:hypothetical protein
MSKEAFAKGVAQVFDILGTSTSYHGFRHSDRTALESIIDSVLALRNDWAHVGADMWWAYLREIGDLQTEESRAGKEAIVKAILELTTLQSSESARDSSRQLTLFEQ